MRIATFTESGRTRLGLVDGDEIVDLAAAAPDLPVEMNAFLAAGAPARARDPHALALRTTVNGELRQDSNTKQLIFDCFALVEHLSTAFTLEPGDVVSTGTPGGVGIARKPPRFLEVGDVVRVEIEGLGALENPVVAEPDTALL